MEDGLCRRLCERLQLREGTRTVADFPVGNSSGEGTYRTGKIWYAHLAGTSQMVPVRMEYDTEFGKVEGYLAEMSGSGVDLRFMD